MSVRAKIGILPKPLLLALFAIALVLRFGPFCEVAMAATPPAAMAMDGCHGGPSHMPEPEKPKPAQMTCLTPCAVLAPAVVPVVSVPVSAAVDGPAPLRMLAGFSAPPEDPPPRLG